MLKKFKLVWTEETEDGYVVLSTDDIITSEMIEPKQYIENLRPECNVRQQILHTLYENIMKKLNEKY